VAYFYNLLLQGKIDTYFTKVNGTGLSDDFKDLILKFFSYDGNLRPTIEQIRAHPWMQSESFNYEATRTSLLTQLAEKQATQQPSEKPSSKPVKVSRRNTAAMV
jgi:serine/threonine protein kinase